MQALSKSLPSAVRTKELPFAVNAYLRDRVAASQAGRQAGVHRRELRDLVSRSNASFAGRQEAFSRVSGGPERAARQAASAGMSNAARVGREARARSRRTLVQISSTAPGRR